MRYITFSRQLQAQLALAMDRKTSFNLVISPNTERIAVPLRRAIEDSRGRIFEFTPVNNQMIERFVTKNKVIR